MSERAHDAEPTDAPTDEERRRVAGREVVEGLADDVATAAALVEVLEEVGEAVLRAAEDGSDAEALVAAGFEALEPAGDDDDALRAGLRWLAVTCSGVEVAASKRRAGPRRKRRASR